LLMIAPPSGMEGFIKFLLIVILVFKSVNKNIGTVNQTFSNFFLALQKYLC